MNLKYHYWYFKNALSHRICDEIILHGKNKQIELGLIGENIRKIEKGKKLTKKDLNNLKKTRNSNVAWLEDVWIYKEIQPYIDMANKLSGWNFQWDYSEPCQFTKYSKNQFYDWHCDSYMDIFKTDNPNTNGKIRKLSVTCSLTDPKEYTGGELEFDLRNANPKINTKIKCKEILPKGSIVVFPSFVWHRVKPVTKGTRHSLVIWNLGHPFK